MSTVSMMSRFRAHWLAVLAGALLIALSASSAFGAGPSGDEEKNHGQQVSEFVHSFFGDVAPRASSSAGASSSSASSSARGVPVLGILILVGVLPHSPGGGVSISQVMG